MNQQSPSTEEKPVSEEAILKAAKEVAIKFIEVGRLTPTNFTEIFRELYAGIKSTVREK